MDSIFHFLRHAETQIDPDHPVITWELTEKGLEQTRNLADSGVFDSIDFIVTSEERKAITTAEPIALRLGIEISPYPAFNELDRGDDFTSREQYLADVRATFDDFNSLASGWESAADVLKRFQKGVRYLENQHKSKRMLIVSHGLVLTLYFASILGVMNLCFQRWSKLKFLAYGIIENGRITRDIV
ncbi:MAG: histidine phosphatase family protein [Candidatus Thorarchaeota archaeon]